jgi:GNAT superfamily N-acetyltransferase
MNIHIKNVSNETDLKIFVHLPAIIHKYHKKWVPPILSEELKYFSESKNKFFQYCDTLLALAYDKNRVVGRIMGIINHRYNKSHGEINARFSYLECYENEQIAIALLDHVEKWARNLGMDLIAGPMGFSDQDPEGYLVFGFDEEPTIASNFNFEYIVHYLESAGYNKDVDYVVYHVPVEVPKFYERVLKRINASKTGYNLVEFRKRKELEIYIKPILNLMNETFEGHHGFTAMDNAEMDSLAKKYLPVLDPRFIKVITVKDDPVAFIIAMPNMNAGLRKANGRLFPFGIFHILRSRKKTKQLDLLIAGINKQYQGRGLDVLMGNAILKSAKDAGFLYIDSHNEDESNLKVRAEMEKANGKLYKRYRVFKKILHSS